MLYLQIISVVISAVFLGLTLPAGTWLGFEWAIGCVLFAVLFFGVCLLCKQYRANKEEQHAKQSEKREETTQEAQDSDK